MSSRALAYRHELDPAKLLQCADILGLDREERNTLAAMVQAGEKAEFHWGKAITRLRDKQRNYYWVLVGLFFKKMKEGGGDVQDRSQVDTMLRAKFLSRRITFTAGCERIDYETGEVIGQTTYFADAPLSISRDKGVAVEEMEEFLHNVVNHYIKIFGHPPPERDKVAEIEQDVAISGLWASLE